MCGIIGSISKNILNKELFYKQLSCIKHRGPDDDGYWFNKEGTAGLGSRRLAIQDLSKNGHMPMLSQDGRYVIVFNGEIYNFPELKVTLAQKGFFFKSNSDTEGVLYAYMLWGYQCLEHLNGMFAIAIFDNLTHDIFLARDRAGEKPLYYWINRDGIEFGSELKVLLQNPLLNRKLNLMALRQYFKLGYAGGDVAFVDGVNKLLPAHYLVYNAENKNCKVERYWSVPKQQINNYGKEELVEELDNLLSRAVQRQLISDVPLGVLLSGGVDSSLIAAYAGEHSEKKVRTFHISFDGFGKYNEAEYARKVASFLNTEHIELSGNDIPYDIIDHLLDYYDEPLADSSVFPTFLVAQLTKQHVTVALGGDGGDELFGGYTHYQMGLAHKKLMNVPAFLRNQISNAASLLPPGFRGRNYLMNFEGDEYSKVQNSKIFDDITLKKILDVAFGAQLQSVNLNPDIIKDGDYIYNITKYDFEHYLPDDILVKVDRASMAVSLELRAPWLDRDVVEFAFGRVPDQFKVTPSEKKLLPKMLLKKKLPIGLDVNRKQGFSIPLNDWIQSRWRLNFLEDLNTLPEHIFNKKYVLSLYKNALKGYTNSSRLFAIVLLNKWLKKYSIEF